MNSESSKNNTRQIILRTIKAIKQASIEDLAQAAGVSPVTVRHHINSLLADGFIVAETIRRKVGRPYFIYQLTDAGHELFPQKYFALSSRLLEELKARFSADVVNDLFRSLVQKIVEEHRTKIAQLPFEGKLDYLVELLASEGFLAKWEGGGDRYRLVEYSCPFHGMGHTHTEVCALDTALIEEVMETKIEKQSCMLDGDDCCQFLIPHKTIRLDEVYIA